MENNFCLKKKGDDIIKTIRLIEYFDDYSIIQLQSQIRTMIYFKVNYLTVERNFYTRFPCINSATISAKSSFLFVCGSDSVGTFTFKKLQSGSQPSQTS